MSMDLKILVDLYPGRDLVLAAGATGMHRRVTWVHISETPEKAGYLSGGELVITTGVGLDKWDIEAALLELVRLFFENGAAGVVVNVGEYIREIPKEVCSFCNAHDFPLFTLPRKAPLERFIQPLTERIVRDNVSEEEVRTAFKNAIFFPDQQERYLVPLSDHHFRREDRYAICVMRVVNTSSDPYALAESIKTRLWNHLREIYPKCAVFTDERDIIAVISTPHTAQVRVLAEDLLDHVCFLLPLNQEKVYIGIGKLTKSMRCIYKSYRQAEAIVKLQMNGSIPQEKIFFTDMGAYRLLLGIEDDEIKQEYYSQVLGPLVRHDQEKDTDLTSVLKLYLQNDGSITRTASKMFVHRNTVNYKINQASKILNMDLGRLDNRMQLMLAFLVHDML